MRADGVGLRYLHSADNADMIAARAMPGRPLAQEKQSKREKMSGRPDSALAPRPFSSARPSAASTPAQRPDLVFAQP